MRRMFAAAALLLACSAPATAQTEAVDDADVNQLIVYGDDPCPPSTDEVITVCARRPDNERYRIPEDLRGDQNAPENQAWGARATELQYVGRSGIGSCSPVGPGGMIGCMDQLVRQARAERAGGADAVNWNALIEKAREERLSRIDAEAEAEEEAANSPR